MVEFYPHLLQTERPKDRDIDRAVLRLKLLDDGLEDGRQHGRRHLWRALRERREQPRIGREQPSDMGLCLQRVRGLELETPRGGLNGAPLRDAQFVVSDVREREPARRQ
jgi:hypothetical protein